MHSTGIGEGFERPGDGEITLDPQKRYLGPACLYDAGGVGARSPAAIDPPSFDRAAPRRVVVDKLRLASELRDGRAELDPHGALIPAPIVGFGQGRARDARSDHGRIG